MRERAVRLVLEHSREHPSQWAAVSSVAAKIGCSAQTLLGWVKRVEVDSGARWGPVGDGRQDQGPGTREPGAAASQRDPAQGVSLFRDGGTRPPAQTLTRFIDAHRNEHGVEPMCRVLPIAPSTYYDQTAKRRDPKRLSARAKRDEALKVEVKRVFDHNFGVYGARKVWRQLLREGIPAARCTVERLMRRMGLKGVIRGRSVRTTIRDTAAACPLDRVNRQFQAPAPNRLWLSDFTYVSTWSDFVYVAFVLDAYARRIVGWRVSRTAHAGFVLDALEQALYERRPVRGDGLNHHSDRADSTCRSSTPSAWLRRGLSRRWAAWEIRMTMRQWKQSTGSTRPS